MLTTSLLRAAYRRLAPTFVQQRMAGWLEAGLGAAAATTQQPLKGRALALAMLRPRLAGTTAVAWRRWLEPVMFGVGVALLLVLGTMGGVAALVLVTAAAFMLLILQRVFGLQWDIS